MRYALISYLETRGKKKQVFLYLQVLVGVSMKVFWINNQNSGKYCISVCVLVRILITISLWLPFIKPDIVNFYSEESFVPRKEWLYFFLSENENDVIGHSSLLLWLSGSSRLNLIPSTTNCKGSCGIHTWSYFLWLCHPVLNYIFSIPNLNSWLYFPSSYCRAHSLRCLQLPGSSKWLKWVV